GEWPAHVKEAIAALAGTERDDDAIGVMLLEDIRQIFLDHGSDKIFSENLVKALHALEERPWSEWGQQRKPLSKTQLAGLLRPFEIRPTTIDIAYEKAKGYKKTDFADAWERYLPPLPLQLAPQSVTPLHMANDAGLHASQPVTEPDPQSVTPLHMANDAGFSVSSLLQTSNDTVVTARNARTSASQNACNGVTDRVEKNVTAQNMRNPAP